MARLSLKKLGKQYPVIEQKVCITMPKLVIEWADDLAQKMDKTRHEFITDAVLTKCSKLQLKGLMHVQSIHNNR